MKECWRLLDLTSRSFSRVIKELDGELARVVSQAHTHTMLYILDRSLTDVLTLVMTRCVSSTSSYERWTRSKTT